VSQAADALARRREAGEGAEEAPAVEVDDNSAAPRARDGAPARAPAEAAAQADTESALEEHDAAPDDDQPSGETSETDEPTDLPPIDPPPSWTKDEKARFKALPRATQEYIAERERARDAELRRGQNDVAEERKALAAEREAALALRRHYEHALPQMLDAIEAQAAGEFADVKTHDDVRRLAEQDPARFAKYQAAHMHIAAVAQEARAAEQRQLQDVAARFNAWAGEQDARFVAQFRELADAEKGQQARASITHYLTEVAGVPREQLPELWNMPVFRDARMQRIVYDAARFHAAREKAKSAVSTPKPPVQRPGTASAKATPSEATIKALEHKLANATSTREQIAAAAALRAAKRAAT
jgi:hypothetical protein